MKPPGLIVIGGGPAGLATAISAALRGVPVTVLERGSYPVDKACGEGVLPTGVAVLQRLGVTRAIAPEALTPIVGIRYVQEDGSRAEAQLPAGGGLGIRRTALSSALHQRALELGVEVVERARVGRVEQTGHNVLVESGSSQREGSFLVAADGLASPVRASLGLDLVPGHPERFGLRQHFHVAPWSDHVEVHLHEGVEAYVTPAGRNQVGLAFLFEKGSDEKPSIARFLERFPELGERLRSAKPSSQPRGAGPLLRPVRTPVHGRIALVGDAAGYVDAVTGEGLSLALACAESLGRCMPEVLEDRSDALAPFVRTWRREFRTYALFTHAVLAIARRPRLRRPLVKLLRAAPFLFSAALGWVTRPRD